MDRILEKLKLDVPEFLDYEEFEEVVSIDFDRLGKYVNILIYIIRESNDNFKKEEAERILKKIFTYLNEIFDDKNRSIVNVIHVGIFELVIETKYGYEIAEEYMSKKMYSTFLNIFPQSKYKFFWDNSNYYSNEEMKRILDSLED